MSDSSYFCTTYSMVHLLCCPQETGLVVEHSFEEARANFSLRLVVGCQTPESALVMRGHILEIVETH